LRHSLQFAIQHFPYQTTWKSIFNLWIRQSRTSLHRNISALLIHIMYLLSEACIKWEKSIPYNLKYLNASFKSYVSLNKILNKFASLFCKNRSYRNLTKYRHNANENGVWNFHFYLMLMFAKKYFKIKIYFYELDL